MKDKPSEWIAISDLMAGVVAVVMLLLVISSLQKGLAEMKIAEMQAQQDPKKVQLHQIMKSLTDSLAKTRSAEMVTVDISKKLITLRDGAFNRGSACVSSDAEPGLEELRAQVALFLADFPDGQVYVEGHTDDRPVTRPVVDYAKFCTVYDDNYTLSAARARETRKALVNDMTNHNSNRVVVAGFGDSQPLPNLPKDSAQQRRVEVRFVPN